MSTVFVLGLITVIWLAAAIPIYKKLRAVIVRKPGSVVRRALFTLVCGTIVAPGLVGFGHPPPMPFPGAALLGFAYLSQIFWGQTGEDGFAMAYINFGSWAVATACIGLGELWRLRSQAYLIREAAVGFARNVAAGLKTGKPGWVIPGVCFVAAIPVFFALNGPVGEPARTQARVIACAPHVHWLIRTRTPYCYAELGDGSIYPFQESDPGVYGRIVTILRFQRRFLGTYDLVLKY